jgi:outer membrane protein TolC
MQTRVTTRRHELLLQMGCPEATIDWRATPLEETKAVTDPPPYEFHLVLLASRQRLDLRAAEWSTEAAMRRIDLSRKEGWPELAVGLSFERAPRGRTRGASAKALAFDAFAEGLNEGLNDAAGHGGGAMPIGPIEPIAPLPRPTREVKYTLGPMFELELPIFDWGQAQTKKAHHAFRRALAEYDVKLQDVVRTVRQTLAEHAQARDQLRLFADVILPEVEANLELARQTYIAGQTDLTIYLQSQEDVIATRTRMVEFLRDYRMTEADLERAVGGPVVWDDARLGAIPAGVQPNKDDGREGRAIDHVAEPRVAVRRLKTEAAQPQSKNHRNAANRSNESEEVPHDHE